MSSPLPFRVIIAAETALPQNGSLHTNDGARVDLGVHQQLALDFERRGRSPRPEMIRSCDARPQMRYTPSTFTEAISPVKNQPSSVKDSRVAFGLAPVTPRKTLGPFTCSSPGLFQYDFRSSP